MIVDLFAGPGGWDEGARLVGYTGPLVGLELDRAACRTAVAAGHWRVQADVAAYPTAPFVGKVDGLIASPPCQSFSQAGNRGGLDDERGQLVWQPLRWARDLMPRWVACEQVPDVLPIWQITAAALRDLGYTAWTGVLNSADYGIVLACPLHDMHYPTASAAAAEWSSRYATDLATAEMAVTTEPAEPWAQLAATVAVRLASRMRLAFAAAATRAEREPALAALAASEAMTTPHGAEVATWTTEATSRFELTPDTAASIASLLSSCLADRSLAARWSTTSTKTRRTTVQRTSRSIAATLITGCGTGPATRAAGCGLCVDLGVPQTRKRAILIARLDGRAVPPEPTHGRDASEGLFGEVLPWVSMADALGWGLPDRPSWAVSGGGTGSGGAEPFANAKNRAKLRDLRMAPAGATSEAVEPRPVSEPAHTIASKGTAAWVHERPATTVQGDPRIGRPGHKDRDKGESQFDQDSVRVTVQEAATLQSFRPDYPWQGTKTSQFQQVGNAVPPLLAAAILRPLLVADQAVAV